MNLNNKIRIIVLALVTSLLIGCGGAIYLGHGKNIKEEPKPGTVFIFGYIDTEDAPFKLQEAWIKQVRPVTKKDHLKMHVDGKQGVFYIENMPVGSYTFTSVGGNEKNPLSQNYWTWSVKKEDRNHRIEKDGFYFLGAFDIRLVDKGGLLTSRKYVTDKINTPSEKDVLQKILVNVKGTKWEAMIKKRIKELS